MNMLEYLNELSTTNDLAHASTDLSDNEYYTEKFVMFESPKARALS